ncbi:Cyclin mcs2 [Lecanosticta acicola]|uniref:Cyclin mcs2 n=1 Tax=Lecanosticta acicola TaxID=111012 RepID=A0AAI9EE57_9PEZI|nr:Cyclin mcs2 [Lecanosticta acicola]
MTTALSEDDLYRTSTQYRLWSFSPEQLAAQRKKTHELALARAKLYQQHGSANGEPEPVTPADCLTAEEELGLVRRYCIVLSKMAARMNIPPLITATGIQYLKRFYLSNSCMTYPPKELYKTVLFLATKTEALHWTVHKFTRAYAGGDAEAVLAPEYKVMQALRFTLDVRHPYRGLKGVLMELLNMIEGIDGSTTDGRSGKEVQEAMMALDLPKPGASRTPWQPRKSEKITETALRDRVMAAYEGARQLLDAHALITDAYFLYTPSQILLAALRLSDPPLAAFYLDTKIALELPARPKILATISSCASLLSSFDPEGGMSKQESVGLEEKLERCRDPSTRDLVKSHRDAKSGGQSDEKDKKRKLERQKSSRDADDLFGPSLSKG